MSSDQQQQQQPAAKSSPPPLRLRRAVQCVLTHKTTAVPGISSKAITVTNISVTKIVSGRCRKKDGGERSAEREVAEGERSGERGLQK